MQARPDTAKAVIFGYQIHINPYLIIAPMLGTIGMLAILGTTTFHIGTYSLNVLWPSIANLTLQNALIQTGWLCLESVAIIFCIYWATSALHMQLQQITNAQHLIKYHYMVYPFTGVMGLLGYIAIAQSLEAPALGLSILGSAIAGMTLISFYYLLELHAANIVFTRSEGRGCYNTGTVWWWNFGSDLLYGACAGMSGALLAPLAVTALELGLGVQLNIVHAALASILISHGVALIIEPVYMSLRDKIAHDVLGLEV